MYTNNVAKKQYRKGGDNVTDEELISGADAARLMNAKRSEITHYEKRGTLPVAKEEWEGNRRKPWYRRSDVEKIVAFRQARDNMNAASAENA
jgi:hypothetical protein